MAQHRVVQADRHLVQNGASSYWSVCVGYHEQKAQTSSKTTRVDYREVLSPLQFREYAALRDWRKAAAERDQIPVFGVFSNEQLSKIVQLTELTAGSFTTIDGIGEVKCERYAAEVFALLQQRRAESGQDAKVVEGGGE